MATQKSIQLTIFLLAFLAVHRAAPIPFSSCPTDERQALLDLTAGAVDPMGRLSSWTGQDCCRWAGIRCDNLTGHVVAVDLRNRHQYYDSFFNEVIANSSSALHCQSLSSSLLALQHLSYLDLSGNYFNSSMIPQFLGSLRELRYLNLSLTDFHGTIPHQLGNLSSLHTLSLAVEDSGGNKLEPRRSLVLDDTNWLTALTSLQSIEIRYAELAPGWIQALNRLPSVSWIRISDSAVTGSKSHQLLPHVNFTSLSVLDLSGNGLTSAVLSWLPNLTHLQYLDLRNNNLQSVLPATIWNMSSLETLILSFSKIRGSIPEARGINNLRRLQWLELSENLLTGQLPNSLGSLDSLRYLSLSSNFLSGPLPASIGNLSELRGLHLWRSGIGGQLPDSIGNLHLLKSLDLSDNALVGPLPASITNFTSLTSLLLARNMLSGGIPLSIGRLSLLEELNLNDNRLEGAIPESLGQLSQLGYLNLGSNSLSGLMTEAHFARLWSLYHLRVTNNSMVALNVSSGWQPPFQLINVELGDCRLGPLFPQWLRTQQKIYTLDLSATGISDSIPEWLWNKNIWELNLSHNEIHGRLPRSILGPARSHVTIALQSNRLQGPLPNQIHQVDRLDLSENSLSGHIPEQLWKNMHGMRYLLLANNNLIGKFPSSLCKLKLSVLDLSGNHLTGELPNCQGLQTGYILDLSYNNLSGVIPNEFLNSTALHSLYLNNNNFTGEVPSILMRSFKYLSIIDLGNNKFSGNIPVWLDSSFTSLRILRLRSNMFDGYIPKSLTQIPYLKILDLSRNNLSGSLPRSFGNFTAMMHQNDEEYFEIMYTFTNKVMLAIKGKDLEYAKLLRFLAAIDLSENNLSGAIPEELANLTWLRSLNLSGNHLTGVLTGVIGGMHQLESLDLSRNELSGPLPQALANLSSLGFLNVSYNNFSGRIPSGGHLDTFADPSIYSGNPYLYTTLLLDPNKKNQEDNVPQGPIGSDGNQNEEDDDNENDMFWFYTSLAPGFVVGFWIVLGVLLFKKRWRHTYFGAIDYSCDMLYVKTAIHLRKFKMCLVGIIK